ncbi:MAG: YceI family protein [Novosphingobium sp.]
MSNSTQQNDISRYHRAAIALHWLIAALLVYQFALGLRLEGVHQPALKFTAFQMHKSVGIAILVLSLARLALRIMVPRPEPVGTRLQQRLAGLAHAAFYAIMLLGPVTGWIIVSTARIKVPTLLFGLIPLPHLPFPAGAHDAAELGHVALAWLLPALLLLHLAAVVYHWRAADPVPRRMLPRAVAPGYGLPLALASLTACAAAGAAGPLPNLWSSLTAPSPVPGSGSAIAATESPSEEALASEAPSLNPASETPSETASEAESEAAKVVSCDWTVAAGSRLGFTASYAGSPVNGTFRSWSARIHFCEDDLPNAAIDASIALGSVDTADASRDENLKGASFFDTASFARARFVAHGFKKLGPGRYSADGTLTLRGAARPVRLTFALKVTGETATAQGSAQLRRLAFGVGTDEWAATDQIADAVAVSFTIKARRKPQAP